MKRITNQTNIVIWQYGTLRTLERAQSFGIRTVNPCWVDQCAIDNSCVDPLGFPIIQLTPKEKEEIQYRERKWFKLKRTEDTKFMDMESKFGQEEMERRIDQNLGEIMEGFMERME